jgi:hypothetical protein
MHDIEQKEELIKGRTRNGTLIGLVTLLSVCTLTAWTIPQINTAYAILGHIKQECYTIGGAGGSGASGGTAGSSDGGPSGSTGTGGTGGAGGSTGSGGTGGAGGVGGAGGNSGEGGGGGESPGGEGGEGGRGGDGDVTCIIDDSFRSRTTIIQNTLSPKSTIGIASGIIGHIAPIMPIP